VVFIYQQEHHLLYILEQDFGLKMELKMLLLVDLLLMVAQLTAEWHFQI
jgi:hypothetical protein